jgi:hypothetical protein
MPFKLPLKMLVVELRYKPDLAFYGKMDAAALDLADELPSWERTPLSVEVRDKKRHRRLFLSHHRAFYQADNPDPETEFSFASKHLRKTCAKIGVSAIERIGIRQWFAADLNKPFALLVDQLAERFLPKKEELAAILGDKTLDLMYAVNCETSEEWKYNLRLGPMLRSQWLQVVQQEPAIYETSEEGEETFEKFQASLPEQFLIIDIDCFRESLPGDELDSFLTTVRRKSHDLVVKLIDYCKR